VGADITEIEGGRQWQGKQWAMLQVGAGPGSSCSGDGCGWHVFQSLSWWVGTVRHFKTSTWVTWSLILQVWVHWNESWI
jgi:hypothetical protein